MKGVVKMSEFTQEQVNELRREAEKAYLIYANLKEQYLSAEKDWLKKSRRFRDADYKKALVDGRLRRIESVSRKETKSPELSLEQIKAIADKLGINITIENTEEIDDTIAEDLEGLND